MADPSRDQVLAVFRAHRLVGEIREVVPRAGDEAVFIVGEEDAWAVRDTALAIALQTLLARKVWVVPDTPPWRAQPSEPL